MKLSLAFVASGLAAFSAVSAADMVKRAPSTYRINDVTILQYALTLENLEAEFYRGGLAQYDDADFAGAGYAPVVRQRLVEIANEEAIHAATLTGALGRNAVKPCKYSFPYTNVDEFLGLARVLEAVGVSAYLGAAPDITSDAYLTVAGSIFGIEARHQAVISEFQKSDGVAAAFEVPLKYNQVFSLASPFIVSCPKSNKPLPFSAFPALTFTGVAAPGRKVKLSFKPQKGCKTYYAHVLSQLNDEVIKIPANGEIVIPHDVVGRAYIIVTNARVLSDKSTVAGPATFEVASADLE